MRNVLSYHDTQPSLKTPRKHHSLRGCHVLIDRPELSAVKMGTDPSHPVVKMKHLARPAVIKVFSLASVELCAQGMWLDLETKFT